MSKNHTHMSANEAIKRGDFVGRHIGTSTLQQDEMLEFLKIKSIDSLIDRVVPKAIRRNKPMTIKEPVSESLALAKIKEIGMKNLIFKSFIGQGYYNTITPSVIQRNILENPAWYTAYTPYQAEISQGRMEAMINFQTMVSDITGMELANASMLDEATACAEAMTFCLRTSKSKSRTFFVAQDCHPKNIEVVQTRAMSIDIEIIVGDPLSDMDDLDLFGALLQYPNTYGSYTNLSSFINNLHNKKALVAMCSDLLALTLLKTPGEMDADVVVGNTQRFGVPLGYGGPHAAFMATREKFKRSLPGRIIGLSVDSQGKHAYRLALQTREQHIRRDKATSNICTAQALLAVMASMYAVYHGPQGLQNIAEKLLRLCTVFVKGLSSLDTEIINDSFFDTISIKVNDSDAIISSAEKVGFNLHRISESAVSLSFDETTSTQDIEKLWQVFHKGSNLKFHNVDNSEKIHIDPELRRSATLLKHEVFNKYHSETEMMRYMRYLSDKDLALDRAMIPLGSCTMKLNAVTELMPISWPEFSQIHPLVPLNQVEGYMQMIAELEEMLCEATGYDAISLQPNSGAQGEYAGLLAIRAYQNSIGEGDRNVCLIPASAHGTNPASAHMAGLKVIVVKTAENGNIDFEDLQYKCEKYSNNLSAIMITYPSTHGIFENNVVEVCSLIHKHGAQVYIDGANMNAMVGISSPGEFGGDVSHLNLHKTFAIPHGGGGPGVGPIGVKSHLAKFLPATPLNESTVTSVSGAPWGSASILPISWMYITLLGSSGLYASTANAILNANYVASRLSDHYPLLYTDKKGMVAHECIIDIRKIKDDTGVSVDDIAKRLIDYGFHAPTMSFPVPGTLMIEPTESESKEELDRFCDAMIQIKTEIDEIENGKISKTDNPLKNAPHTAEMVTSSEWGRPYTREQAAYPIESLKRVKYWSPVARVDNVYGDKNLVCSCPSVDAYE